MRSSASQSLCRLFILAAVVVISVAQSPAQTDQSPSSPQITIRAESKLVLVDAIVTDKKGGYVKDLEAKDFHVFEDGKEQPIKSFSFEADATPNQTRPHYLVLFFDNSSTELSDQQRARDAAAKFIDANADPNRLIAIVNFTGALKVSQDFTTDKERLKRIVAGVSRSNVTSNPELAFAGSAVLSRAELDFGQDSVLRGLQSLAKSLSTIPGRKTVIFISAGFVPTNFVDYFGELSAAINACNKANVAVYPIDIRGLLARLPSHEEWTSGNFRSVAYQGAVGHPTLELASFHVSPGVALFQRPGGTGGRPGGTGGTPRPTPGGTRTAPPTREPVPPAFNPQRQPYYVPPFLTDPSKNQDGLLALALGTGGFIIKNTNDLLSGFQKIASEQNQYYVLGYSPNDPASGSCHALKVKVDRKDTNIRSRPGYCASKPLDLLAGNPEEKQLQAYASGAQNGKFQTSGTAPFFYTTPNVARVDLNMEIPTAAMKVEKDKGKYHATVNVLGAVTGDDGSVAARFSDTVKLDFEEKSDLEKFQKQPFHYEKQFEVPAGKHQLKVVFSSGGQDFGRVEMPLAIEPNSGKQFAVSGIALSNKLINLKEDPQNGEDALLEDRTPLIVNQFQIVPSADNQFKKSDTAVLYLEVYEPLLTTDKSPTVTLAYRVVDRQSGAVKFESGPMNMAPSIHAGNPVIPIGLQLVTSKLDPGDYRLELQAKDSAGSISPLRTANFQVQ